MGCTDNTKPTVYYFSKSFHLTFSSLKKKKSINKQSWSVSVAKNGENWDFWEVKVRRLVDAAEKFSEHPMFRKACIICGWSRRGGEKRRGGEVTFLESATKKPDLPPKHSWSVHRAKCHMIGVHYSVLTWSMWFQEPFPLRKEKVNT